MGRNSRCRYKRLVSVGHRLIQNIADDLMVEMPVQRHRAVEAEMFFGYLLSMDHAKAEGDLATIITPDQEPHSVRHPLTDLKNSFVSLSKHNSARW